MTAPAQTKPQPAPAQTETSSEAPLLDKVIAETCRRLDRVAKSYADAIADQALGRLERALLIAQGIDRLRTALTKDIMRRVMPLMNTMPAPSELYNNTFHLLA